MIVARLRRINKKNLLFTQEKNEKAVNENKKFFKGKIKISRTEALGVLVNTENVKL